MRLFGLNLKKKAPGVILCAFFFCIGLSAEETVLIGSNRGGILGFPGAGDALVPGLRIMHLATGKKLLYAAGKIEKSDAVAAIRTDAVSSSETVSVVKTGGRNTCHISLSPEGKFLLAADYSAGNISQFELAPDGTLVPAPPKKFKHHGSGPAPRQTGPHPHFIAVAPGGRFAVVADLGCDRIFAYPFDSVRGITGDAQTAFTGVPGSGPRHLVFARDGKRAWLVNELDSTVCALKWDAEHGKFSLLKTLPTRLNAIGESYAGAIALSPDEKNLYVTNRGENSIAIFRITPDLRFDSGVFTPEYPYDLCFGNDETLIVPCLKADALAVFRRTPADGGLNRIDTVATPRPISAVRQP